MELRMTHITSRYFIGLNCWDWVRIRPYPTPYSPRLGAWVFTNNLEYTCHRFNPDSTETELAYQDAIQPTRS
jgi:hypothetical protein